jgi:hypothetical protein
MLKLARSLLLSAVLLTLGACQGPPARPLGDTSVPLMQPGYGLVATTLVYRSRDYHTDLPTHTPSYRKAVAFYAPLPGAGGTAFVVQPYGDTRASYVHRQRSDDADHGFLIFLTPVKPGRYVLDTLLVDGAKEQHPVFPKHPPSFEVIEGQVTYAGTVDLLTDMEKRYGLYAPVSMGVQVVDAYAYDVATIKEREPRLRAITIRNGLAPQDSAH